MFAAKISPAIIVDKIVAVVNGEIITLNELQKLEKDIQKLDKDEETGSNSELSQILLNKLIDKKLQLQLAAKKQINVSDQQIQAALAEIKRQNDIKSDADFKKALSAQGISLEEFIQQWKENTILTLLVKREIGGQIEISDQETEGYYREHQAEFTHLDELRAQHILFYLPADATAEQISSKEEKAKIILEKLKQGEDFAVLAGQFSDDPSAEKGGDLGYFHMGEIIPALEEALLSLAPGQISEIVKTGFGLHIVKLNEYKRHTLENDPDLREDVKQRVYREKSKEHMTRWMEKLRKEANIRIMY
ncbi:MAG: peptidylprolyl isomerase [Candidatus Schekmanbacteria bacterium]|nr:peptidylprolyl isomerase [Candidatus Schekmanbacteria bacterium]